RFAIERAARGRKRDLTLRASCSTSLVEKVSGCRVRPRRWRVSAGRSPREWVALRPGDLLFFANDGTNINHVAIYAGQDRIIHATASGAGVRYDTLGEGERGEWFADHLVKARRVTRAEGRDATER